ncbi:helix-turn-helix transcriptional regulator [Chelatococcus asaccharovorans]|uniref:helix-turn-helix transcriptional regulator n=1 Tax=Chelatococcus asaccharovorans TaxID=28210 RepID=UPI00224C6BA0|nr:hypothetical protein [Chelatococcus asaccharovorans]CAH1671793.1 conserved hypothetical protein [Chelatococcus asaccharovorans]CAH1676796.1 conserved hypothetical protein [Chelatococcus asaccharovorans]
MTSRSSAEPAQLMIAPRGLSREQAAAYCGLKPSGFDYWINRGRLPGAIPGTKRWDRRALDAAWDKLSGLDNKLTSSSAQGDDEFAQWLRDNGHAG